MISNITLINNLINEELQNRKYMIENNLNKILTSRRELEQIKIHIDDFINDYTDDRFIVMPGLRGTGKTTLLFQIYNYLLEKDEIKSNQVLYLSGDMVNDLTELNILEIIEHFIREFHEKSPLRLDKKLFILIDEIQYDPKWSLRGKILYDKTPNLFMIFTGYHSLDLEINVDAARRILKIPVNPLNYGRYLELKYNINLENSRKIRDMLFTAKTEDGQRCERKIKDGIINSGIPSNEWENYLKYGGFPFSFNEKNHFTICAKLNDMVSKIIKNDLAWLENISSNSITIASRLVRYLSLSKPGENSKNKLANILDTSIGNIQTLLANLEKTHLIYSIEPLSSSSKRIRKSWKYYFATASLKHNIAKNYGIGHSDLNAYYGVLSENLVASTLKSIANTGKIDLYYDANKGGVDFLIQTGLFETIPIEVGYGKKTKKQIKTAMNRYDASHGIIVSNTTPNIEKEDDILYIPLETFSLV